MAMKQSLLSASASASAHVTQTLKRPLASLKRRWQDCQTYIDSVSQADPVSMT